MPKLIAVLALGTGAYLHWVDRAGYGLTLPFVAVALWLFLSDRERYWRIRCDRCRGKKCEELRGTKPRPGTDIIDPFL